MLSPEHAAHRLGRLGSSDAAVVMGDLKTLGMDKLVKRCAGERVYGDLGEPGFKSWAMERGEQEENAALDWIEFTNEWEIERQAHLVHPNFPWVTATPDGLMRGLRTIEGKCPLFHVWAETRELWQRGKRALAAIPSEYRWQCRWQVWVAGVPEGVFVTFHPVQGGQGIQIPYEVTQSERDQMAERTQLVEGLIRNWEEILRGK